MEHFRGMGSSITVKKKKKDETAFIMLLIGVRIIWLHVSFLTAEKQDEVLACYR